jgi:hypothetical protein
MSESDERPDYYESDREDDEEGDEEGDEEEVVEEVVDEEGDEEGDEEVEEGSPHLVAGVNQYTHMGFTDCLYEDPLAGLAVGMDARTRFKHFGALTSEQTFRKTAKQYIDSTDKIKGYLNMAGLCFHVDKIKKFEYINPKAFVIAYFFINRQAESSHQKKKIKDADLSQIVSDFIDEDVTILDVVRYIRFIRGL